MQIIYYWYIRLIFFSFNKQTPPVPQHYAILFASLMKCFKIYATNLIRSVITKALENVNNI